MNFIQMKRQWLDHNELGTSKDTGRSSPDTYYRKNVLYSNNHPTQRFVWGRRGKSVVLVWHPTYPAFDVKVGNLTYGPRHNIKTVRFDHTQIYVPDIGVFSRHEDDQRDDEELHDRMKYILLMEVRSFTEDNAESLNGKVLDNERWSSGGDKMTVGKQLIETLGRHYRRWNFYSDTFGLGWNELPSIYMDQLKDTIDKKVSKYNDPKAVVQRERAEARKKAKAALGVG